MERFTHVFRYLRFLYRIYTERKARSPFVHDLLTNIINERKPYYVFANIESVRSRLLQDHAYIDVTDYGTGKSKTRKISGIARKSLKKPKAAELLFRLVNRFQPQYVLELGTSLGITTSYLASVSSGIAVHTLEGCHQTATIARKTFDALHLSNTTLHEGPFDQTLDQVIAGLPSLDFVYLDGNHTYKATVQYFEKCLKKMNDRSVLVLDDIHWSREMEAAWVQLRNNPRVTVSLDFFEMGMIILNPKCDKQSFSRLL